MSTTLPDISVIVAAHNHDKWLERCIRSLSHQQHVAPEAYEIVLVDDASTDHTPAVLEHLKVVENLRVLVNDENLGLPASLNRAIQDALGRYVVRVDSDDYVAREFLYLMKLFLDKNRDYQGVAMDYLRVNEFEEVQERVNCMEEEIACGVMYRKECLFDVGLYDEEFLMREGHELRQRFEEKFRVGRLEFPFYKYRAHARNRTRTRAEELAEYDRKLGRT